MKLSQFPLMTLAFICAFSQYSYAENVKVNATYKVEFGGFDLGDFRFQSQQTGNKYRMSGSTKLSILKGAVMKWKMHLKSEGVFSEQGPEPTSFSYHFKDRKKKRNRQLSLQFASENSEMVVKPELKKSKKRIPIEPKHLNGVFDPMSALILLTNSEEPKLSRKVCDRTVKLFDGKERYDIAFQYKKVAMSNIGNKAKKKTLSYVCSIKYIPVAGHKKKDKTKNYMKKVKGIEVWFAPFKQANMYVPHKIKIPTPFGPNTIIRARHFNIQNNDSKPVPFIR